MIYIQKSSTPPTKLVEFQRNNECFSEDGKKLYEKFKDQCRGCYNELKQLLLEEQHELCCYCMTRIKNNSVNSNKEKPVSIEHFKPNNSDESNEEKPITIEHFKPKQKFKELALDYYNLLGCCNRRDNNVSHCGNSKGNKKLKEIPNPSDPKYKDYFEQAISRYNSKGQICVNDKFLVDVNKQINALEDLHQTLNLNDEIHVNARSMKLKCLVREYNNLGRKRKKIDKEKFLEKYVRKNGYFPFYGFVKYHFKSKKNDE